MRWKPFAAGLLAGAIASTAAFLTLRSAGAEAPQAPPPVRPAPPPAFDAAQIASGRFPLERMPPEVTAALELQSDEIVKTAELVAAKQARVSGACPPGSAIRAVNEDGSVACQKLPRGAVSVSAVSGTAWSSSTKTALGEVGGALGRYQIEGEDDVIVIPVQLPDGVVVTSFSYTSLDAHPRVDGEAILLRSDGAALARLRTEGASDALRTEVTHEIASSRIDNALHAYLVTMRISSLASLDVMPVSASIVYRLP